MNLVQNNPYRLLGLLVGATALEQHTKINKLRMYLQAGQELQDAYSFSVVGKLNRTLENIDNSVAKLSLNRDKIELALFWFYDGKTALNTDLDAFNALKDGDIGQAIGIWTRIISNKEVLQRSASAYSNLGTLYLSGILNETNSNESPIEKGIVLKLKFLESDFVEQFTKIATDDHFKITKKEIQLLFLNQVQSEIEKSGNITSNRFLDILTKQEFSAKEEFLIGFALKPIEQIEKKIKEAKTKRKANKANKANAVNVGKTLYEQTSESLKQVKSILGTSNLKFSSISDKISDEILQCGIDYFNHLKDSNIDPGSTAMEVFKKAQTLAVGNIAKQRCQENIDNLQEWIDDKPERDKQASILRDMKGLNNLINEYEGQEKTVSNARQLLASAGHFLNNIKSVLGRTNEIYLGYSTRIASDALGMCVSEINNLHVRLSNTNNAATKLNTLLILKQKVNEAWKVTNTIGSMDVQQNFRSSYNQNRTILSNTKIQLEEITRELERAKRAHKYKWIDDNIGCLASIIFAIIILIIFAL